MDCWGASGEAICHRETTRQGEKQRGIDAAVSGKGQRGCFVSPSLLLATEEEKKKMTERSSQSPGRTRKRCVRLTVYGVRGSEGRLLISWVLWSICMCILQWRRTYRAVLAGGLAALAGGGQRTAGLAGGT